VHALLVAGVIIVVGGLLAYPVSRLIAKQVVKVSPPGWQPAWKFACFIAALWPLGALLVGVAILDRAATHKVFGSDPGNNVTFALIIAVVGTGIAALIGWGCALYGRTIAWSLDRALPQTCTRREQFNKEQEDIVAGRDRENAIARVLDPPGPLKKPKPKIVLNQSFLIENRDGEYQVSEKAGKAAQLTIAKVHEAPPVTVPDRPPNTGS
jgi:hypothetical protein